MIVSVKVKFFVVEDEATGCEDLIIETENTLSEAIEAIEKASGFPLSRKLNRGYSMLINGRSYYLLLKEGFTLSEGDKIVILPKLGGG